MGKFKNTGEAQLAIMHSLGRATTGTTVIALGAYLGAKGMMTGDYPSSKVEADAWVAEGKQPNSILIDGRWYQLGRVLGPVGLLLGLGSDINSLSQDNHGIDLVGAAATDAIKKVGDLPFLMGLSGTLAAINDPGTTGAKFIQNSAGSLVPNIITRLTASLDTAQKNPQGVWQKIESKIPGLSKNVPDKRDMFGNIIRNPGEELSFFDPFSSTKNNPSPILDEAQRVGANISTPDQTLFNNKLDNKQYSLYEKYIGYKVTVGMTEAIQSDGYQSLSPTDQKNAFEQTLRSIHQLSDATIFPVLMEDKYKLPADTDPDKLTQILDHYGSDKDFKKASITEQKKIINYWLNKNK